MIPKIIHYCWFGRSPLPESARRCINSWKRFCPDYELIEWNEDNFDFSTCQYAKEAYEARKWAFVSDYARFYIINSMGGIYFDTDVELIKDISIIVENGAFMGIEKSNDTTQTNAGLGLAAEAHNPLFKEIVDYYESLHFVKDDGTYDTTTVCTHVTEILKHHGFISKDALQKLDFITIYPSEYFCPQNFITRKTIITENTYSIHHYDSSWYNDEERYSYKLRQKLSRIFPGKLAAQMAWFFALCKYHGIQIAIRRTIQHFR